MIGEFLSWYFLVSLLGLLTFPICYRLFGNLNDRGYSFSKIFGLLIWGYFFWLFGSLQIIQNDGGGVLLAFLLLAGISGLVLRRTGWNDVKDWARKELRVILVSELVFLLFFLSWAFIRSIDPTIEGTEKPMELAFINAILRSPGFPPNDPWLSGYAISYYYFGYVLVAILIRATGVSAGVGFNLASALWFGLTAVGVYGIIWNLISRMDQSLESVKIGMKKVLSPIWALLGPFFVLIISNFEGFLEMLHARGVFWQTAADGSLQSSFWKWIDLQELVNPPTVPYSFIPQRISGIWWWRASRVLQDYSLAGDSKEIIDEFPFFSYLLADLHPHVLAVPFVLIAIGLGLNLYFGIRKTTSNSHNLFRAIRVWLSGGSFSWYALEEGGLLRGWNFWVVAIVLGGLAFLNTWDFPIYVGLFSCVYVLKRYQEDGWSGARIGEFIETGIILGTLGILFYLPFYFGFSSQAGGIIPSLSFFTRGIHFWIMFGPLLLPLLLWLVWLWRMGDPKPRFVGGLVVSAAVVFGLWLVSYILGWIGLNLPLLGSLLAGISPGGISGYLTSRMATAANEYFALQGGSDAGAILLRSFLLRFQQPGTWVTLLFILAVTWALLKVSRTTNQDPDNQLLQSEGIISPNSNTFVILLILAGVGLTLIPEFIYLRDQFGWRMNTIFKFYYQAWILWALAAAYATIYLLNKVTSRWRYLFTVVCIVSNMMAIAYPVFGLRMKILGIRHADLTFDGTANIGKYNPDEMKAIQWLQAAPMGIVAEAVGGSYTGFARISTHTGQPTVLGWPGHESQWRGGAKEMGSREADIRTLYRTSDWNEAKNILKQYNIHYVYIGAMERSTYRVNEVKFQNNLKQVFANNSVVIYEVPNLNNSNAKSP